MVILAVCSRFVSLLDPYDIHSGFLCILQVPLFGPHSYFYVSWYEHGYARLVQMIRWFLIHYWGYVLFSPCSWFEIDVPGFSWFFLLSTPQEKQIWLMMSIGHTMSSCPRTSGGNLLTPKKGSLPHLPHYMAHLSISLPYFHQKPIKPSKNPPKGLKCPQKAIKPSFPPKNIQNSSKKEKNSKKEEKYKIKRKKRKKP